MTIEQANKILKDALYDENTPQDYLLAVRMARKSLEFIDHLQKNFEPHNMVCVGDLVKHISGKEQNDNT